VEPLPITGEHLLVAELAGLAPLRDLLIARVGRVLWNGFPTGVSVTHAQHHGGPYPATSDPRATSVGSTAIDRFLRPVAFQDLPEALLPPVLRTDEPLGLRRIVDGVRRSAGPA
jgi:alpha-ketoglutaric semialdehyde dehydrogenase